MIKKNMLKKVEEECPLERQNESQFSSKKSVSDHSETVSNIISLAEEKKKQQRELLFEKLRKGGFLK